MIDFFVGLIIVAVIAGGIVYFKKKGTLKSEVATVQAEATKVETEVKKVL